MVLTMSLINLLTLRRTGYCTCSELVQSEQAVAAYAGHTASDEVFEKLTGIKGGSVPVLPTLFRLTAVSSRMNARI